MTRPINYRLIADALDYYQSLGYTYIEVPWLVDRCHNAATTPDGGPGVRAVGYDSQELDCKSLVGSAEQSFISLLDFGEPSYGLEQCIYNDRFKPGKYCAVTPCFRDEVKYDLYTRPYFMKVELFDNSVGYTYEILAMDAYNFMLGNSSEYDKLRFKKTDAGVDIMMNGIEMGSYGYRRWNSFGWSYGTGIAEPRFSVTVKGR
jgi:hypothetical protein